MFLSDTTILGVCLLVALANIHAGAFRSIFLSIKTIGRRISCRNMSKVRELLMTKTEVIVL